MSQAERPPASLDAGGFRLDTLAEEHWQLEAALSRDPDVIRWTYYPANLDTNGARAQIARAIEGAGANRAFRYAIRGDEGAPALGTAGIRFREQVAVIFYALLPAGRGLGAATAAAQSLSGWALANGYPVVELETIAGNAASERVAERAGFALVGEHDGEQRGTAIRLRTWHRTSE